MQNLTHLIWCFVCAQPLSHARTLWDPKDCSPPSSSVCGILQPRVLEWVAISLSTQGSNPRLLCLLYCKQIPYHWATGEALQKPDKDRRSQKWKSLRRVQLSATPWTVASQAPLSKGFSRQEYWNGLPFPSRGDLPNPGMEPRSLTLRQILYHMSYQGSPMFCDIGWVRQWCNSGSLKLYVWFLVP